MVASAAIMAVSSASGVYAVTFAISVFLGEDNLLI